MPTNILIVSNCDNLLVFALKAFERTTLQRPWAKFLEWFGIKPSELCPTKIVAVFILFFCLNGFVGH